MRFFIEQSMQSLASENTRARLLIAILFVTCTLKAGQGISAKTCGLDDVFPPDDVGSGPCTLFIIYIPHIIAAFLLTELYSF